MASFRSAWGMGGVNTMFCAITLLVCSLLLGCITITDMDRFDRIPHVANKGYVDFSITVPTSDGKKRYGTSFTISKIEHSYRIPIDSLSKPISERPGIHTYILRYYGFFELVNRHASEISHSVQRELSDKAIAPVESVIIAPDRYVFLGNRQEMTFEVEIVENMVTPVQIRGTYQLSREREIKLSDNKFSTNRGIHSAYELGEITVSFDKPKPISKAVSHVTGQEDGERVYAADYPEVFRKTVQTAKNLRWNVKHIDEENGTIRATVFRLLGPDFEFTIGVYRRDNGIVGVDFSSDVFWLQWGSFNTKNSYKQIDRFYSRLDTLLAES